MLYMLCFFTKTESCSYSYSHKLWDSLHIPK